MNLIPQKGSYITGNYLCTWGFQAGWHSYAPGISSAEDGCVGLRNGIDGESLFMPGGILDSYPKELRGDLIIVLDDGWDVPYNTSNPRDKTSFGSCDPSPDRFPDMGDTQAERLRNLSDKVKSYGFRGLGLWISPQFPGQPDEPFSMETFASHWEKNARLCGEAGISYWKIDWGAADHSLPCRLLLSELAARFAPGLLVEHAWVGGVFADNDERRKSEDFAQKLEFIGRCVNSGDFWRTYDVSPMAHAVTMSRLSDVFRAASEYQGETEGRRKSINVEHQTEIGAPLGCSAGLMSHPKRTPSSEKPQRAALLWSRIAPPYAHDVNAVHISDELLTDSGDYTDWNGRHIGLTLTKAPSAISRGTRLPEVKVDAGCEKPFAVCSVNPVSGASSIGLFSRTIGGVERLDPADVVFYAGSAEKPVGIFGSCRSLKIRFDGAAPLWGRRVTAQAFDMDEAVDVTGSAVIDGDALLLGGDMIRSFGDALVIRLS